MFLKGVLCRLEGVQAHCGGARVEPFLTVPSEVIAIQFVPPGPHANTAQSAQLAATDCLLCARPLA